MAKSKNSRALFEVIKQSQELSARRAQGAAKPRGGLLSWLTNRNAPKTVRKTRVVQPAEPVMREIASPEDQREPVDEPIQPLVRRRSVERPAPELIEESEISETTQSVFGPDRDDDDQPAAEATETVDDRDAVVREMVEEQPAAESSPEVEAAAESTRESEPQTTSHRSAEPSLADDDFEPASRTLTPHDTAITTALTGNEDEDVRKTATRTSPGVVHLTLSYPTLGISAIALVMLLAVAFLAGRQTSRKFALSGPSLDQLQAGKANPQVMDIFNATPTDKTVANTKSTEPPPQAIKVETPAKPEETAATGITPDRRRVAGRNYIIAQSYPDPDNADKAAALLKKNSIPVTIEQLDAAPGWYCIVTEVGFDRVSSPDCERYQKLIKDLNGQAKTARVKGFEPYLYKWMK